MFNKEHYGIIILIKKYYASKYAVNMTVFWIMRHPMHTCCVRWLRLLACDPRKINLVCNSDCNLRRTLSFSHSVEISMEIMTLYLFMRRHTREIPPRDYRTFLRERYRWTRVFASRVFKIFLEITSCSSYGNRKI